MKEILFGWITKGQYQLSFLDGVVALIEIYGGTFTVLWIAVSIKEYIDKFKKTKNEILKRIKRMGR